MERVLYDLQDIWNTTWYPKASNHVNTNKPWFVVDATDKILGRLASTIANHIRGKNLASYTPSVDMGAFVIVVNAEKVAVSGKKRNQKLYRRHSRRRWYNCRNTMEHRPSSSVIITTKCREFLLLMFL